LDTTELINILQNPKQVSKTQTSELEDILQQYPYFQSARALYLKGLKQKDSFKYNQALRTTAAYSTDRSILFDFITSDTFNQNKISLAIKFNSEQLKSMSVYEHEDISVDKSVSIDEALKQHIKNTEGVLDPNLFETKNYPANYQIIGQNELIEVDGKNIKETPEETLELGKPLNFDRNETHSFTEWLKITSFKPIDRSKKINEQTVEEQTESKLGKTSDTNQNIEKKFELIDKFLERNPKIIPTKDPAKIDSIPVSNTSNDELMTETLARIYLEQKNYGKAIQSYKILSLKYPEKSGFFADQIKAVEKLQEKIKKE